VSQDAGAVAEFVRDLFTGAADQVRRPAYTVVNLAGRSVREDRLDQSARVTLYDVGGRDGDRDRGGDALGVGVGDDGGGRGLQSDAFEITRVVRAERCDTHGGAVAHGALTTELRSGGGTPGLAIAQGAQQDDRARPVPTVRVVTIGEGGGKGIGSSGEMPSCGRGRRVSERSHGMRIRLVQGDITREEVDAVVNAANSSLLGGGGVDGAIHRRGGPEILEECRRLRASHYGKGLPTGQAVATTAGRLPARWVIHTVGPVYAKSEDRSALLASCYRESLRVAAELGAATVAFPAVSAGIYGWPLDDAARIAVGTVRETSGPVEEVRFVLFTADVHQAFEQALNA
jgi:O-acetyl-ADP-ribose deacetylase (regulator of RNase III)